MNNKERKELKERIYQLMEETIGGTWLGHASELSENELDDFIDTFIYYAID